VADSSPRSTRGIALLLAALSSLGPFAIDTYLPSFHEIGSQLNATPIEVQQTLSAYLLSLAAMTLWHGAISDRFGRRRVILVALALFAGASAGCALATRIEQLWFWRALQGITAGAGIVISRAIVRDLFDGAAAQRLMSQITMMFALAPAIAPLIGGQLQNWFGWRSVFAFLVGATVASGAGLLETAAGNPAAGKTPALASPATWRHLLEGADLAVIPVCLRRTGLQFLRFLHLRAVGSGLPDAPPRRAGNRVSLAVRAFAMCGLMSGSWSPAGSPASSRSSRRSPTATS
jgi:DHA1 family bicyclomycin/chloramphenicol resistance-like MFS transporter